MFRLILILFLFFPAIAGSCQNRDSSDYLIYSIVIDSNISKNKKSVVVINRTSRDKYYDPWYGDTTNLTQIMTGWSRFFRSKFDLDSYVLYREFDVSKSRQIKLTNEFRLPVEIILLKKSSFKRFFRKATEPGWEQFYKKYPQTAGVFEFSPIHYSKDKTKAVLYFAVRKNGLNGGGSILILSKKNDKWEIVQEGSLWMN